MNELLGKNHFSVEKMLDFDVFTECVTNQQTDRPTDTANYRGALSHLKKKVIRFFLTNLSWSVRLSLLISVFCHSHPLICFPCYALLILLPFFVVGFIISMHRRHGKLFA